MKKERDDSFSCVAAIIYMYVHVNCIHNYYFIP